MNNEIIAKVEEAINRIRPYINRDGGEIELVEVTPKGIVRVRMHGACVGCAAADQTLYDGLEKILIEFVPGIIAVELVEDNND